MKLKIILIIVLSFIWIQFLTALSDKEKKFVIGRISAINKSMPAEHPRILILKSELDDFRKFMDKMGSDENYGYIFKKSLLNKFGSELLKEPQRLPQERTDGRVKLWREAYNTAFKAGITAQHYALGYLITGKNLYAGESARWLMHIAGWDAENGGCDIKNNDEAFIQSFRPMILAYDWVYDGLKPEERKIIEDALMKRLTILFKHVTSVYSAVDPIPVEKNSSHKMRFISTIGLCGLALYHENDFAKECLAWAYEYYLNLFPCWGGVDGGYSEGLDYWTTGHSQHFMFLESMKALGFTEFFNRDYFRNNGYFALYNVMPYPFSSFGDLNNPVEPNDIMAMHIEKYSMIYKDPYLLKFHQLIFKKYPSTIIYYGYSFFDSIFQLYRKKEINIEPKSLSELPRSRCFRDVGWVSMHSDPGSKDNDIMLGFKSSPYGSGSHSFADQNSFVLNAFGDQLAISAGYREWYGSAHHYGWSKTTLSKNAILFNNQGQKINDANANGSITGFFTGNFCDYAQGDAMQAYKANSLNVTKALRKIIFVNKKYFVIFDELESSVPYNHQWLLHSKQKMTENYNDSSVVINGIFSEVNVKFLYPDKNDFKFKQTDKSAVPVSAGYSAKYPDEWHFTLSTKKAEKNRNFITILYPHKKIDSNKLDSRLTETSNGFIINNKTGAEEEMVLISKNNNALESNNFNFIGNIAVLSNKGDESFFFMAGGTFLKNDKYFISSDNQVNLEAEFKKERMNVIIKAEKETLIRIKIPFVPVNAAGIERGRWSYSPENQTVEIKINKDSNIIFSR